jgi:hypothetical protein
MHPFLQRQQLEYAIVVVEQSGQFLISHYLSYVTWNVTEDAH